MDYFLTEEQQMIKEIARKIADERDQTGSGGIG